MSCRFITWTCAAALLAPLALPHDAAAQGRGRPKHAKSTTTVQEASAGIAPPAGGFRQFGSWLDDASAPTPGEGRTGIGVGYWRMSEGSQVNVPMLDAGYGVNNRLQVSASVPFYRTSVQGTTIGGIDDVYLSAKVTAIDPAGNDRQFGVAVSPVLEMLSAGGEGGRFHYAIPVSVEIRHQPFRAYGSAGYFSRGAFFTGGALEVVTGGGLVFTGALTHSYSMNEDLASDALGISRTRMDVTGGVGYAVTEAMSGYVSLGRSLTSVEQGGTKLALSGGVSIRFVAPKAIR
jgi:hypothetical protein